MNGLKIKHLIIIIVLVIVSLFIPSIPQDLSYHDFADKKTLLGINNFADVVSNVGFLFVGINGLYYLKKHDKSLSTIVYFLGLILTCFGSAYYHYNPSNNTLFWDRLPMAIVFMILASKFLEERVNKKFGNKLIQLLFVIFGVFSVVWWLLFDDLKYYIVVQFLPLVYMIYKLYRQRGEYNNFNLYMALGFYILAKILEVADKSVFALTGNMISGHTLKHIAAAIGSYYAGLFVLEKKDYVLYDDAYNDYSDSDYNESV